MRYLHRTALACLLVAFALASSVKAQVLDQVPADALVVLKVKNLQDVSKKVAKWAEALGLAAQVPEMADPLASLQEKLHIEKGLDTAGELAIVYVDPGENNPRPDESVLVLIPTTDYKALVANMKDAQTEGEVTRFKTPEGGTDLYAVSRGKYAAVSPSKDILGKKAAGVKLAAAAGREAVAKDAILWANMPALRAKALPELQKARTEIDKSMQQKMANEPQAAQNYAPVLKTTVAQLIGLAEKFMSDSEAATLGVNLGDAGLSSTLLTEFKADSYFGKIASGVKNTDKPLISGLPERKYLMAVGASTGSKAFSQAFAEFVDPISKDLAAAGDEGKKLSAALDAFKSSFAAMDSASFGYVTPSGKVGQDAILQQVAVYKGDAKTIAASQKQALAGMAELMGLLPKQSGLELKFDFKEGAQTVDGVKLDAYTLGPDPAAQGAVAMQMRQQMQMMYGPNGAGGVMGAVDDKTYIMAQGANEKLLSELIAAAKAQQDPLAKVEGVAAVSKQLPKDRFAVGYLALDEVLTTVGAYAKQYGMPFNFQLRPNLPPIGMAASTDGSAIRVDSYVPLDLIQSVVAAAMQIEMQMRGGGGGGAPGDGGPEGL